MKNEGEKSLFEKFESSISMKAKDFADEITNVTVQQKGRHGKASIEKEHADNYKAVRDMLLSCGIPWVSSHRHGCQEYIAQIGIWWAGGVAEEIIDIKKIL